MYNLTVGFSFGAILCVISSGFEIVVNGYCSIHKPNSHSWVPHFLQTKVLLYNVGEHDR